MIAHKGQIVDATFIEAPKQRNPKDENELIKANRVPVNWTKNKRAQKDTAARWTIKGNERHYGYKKSCCTGFKYNVFAFPVFLS